MLSSILSFDETWKFRVHVTQICLIVLAIILSIGRVAIRNPPATRANTVAITLVRNTRTPALPHTDAVSKCTCTTMMQNLD